jgi:endonuclease/exonuclease/phosphatase family metal-dependent hydrolase
MSDVLQRLKVLSLNVDRHRQAKRQKALLRSFDADVLCLQEAEATCVAAFQSIGYSTVFAPQWTEQTADKTAVIGSLIATRLKDVTLSNWYIRGSASGVPDFKNGNIQQSDIPRALQSLSMMTAGGPVNIFNLHFTWSANGQPSALQRTDAHKVSEYLQKSNDFALFADFNAPAHGEIMKILATGAKAGHPDGILSTLDDRFHYANDVKIVVDGFIVKGGMEMEQTSARFGVSDHCAILSSLQIRSARSMSWSSFTRALLHGSPLR